VLRINEEIKPMTDRDYIRNLRIPTEENPLRILLSACLLGTQCAFDGGTYGEYPGALQLTKYRTARLITFCPEDFSFGTPRELCDIHGGTGDDVLDGKAKVLTASGADWSEGMIRAAQKMSAVAKHNDVELCVMMDISAACGSQVIYNGNRLAENKIYQIGKGVAAAQLCRDGFKVISQRDFASLEILYKKLDGSHEIDTGKTDHHEHPWYREYFNI
jgi:uncharacterized protein YbbK (DUF523 family)